MKVELTDRERNMYRNYLARKIAQRAVNIYIHVKDKTSCYSVNGMGIKVEGGKSSISKNEYDRHKKAAKKLYKTFVKLGFGLEDLRENIPHTPFDVPARFVTKLIQEA